MRCTFTKRSHERLTLTLPNGVAHEIAGEAIHDCKQSLADWILRCKTDLQHQVSEVFRQTGIQPPPLPKPPPGITG